MNEINRSGSYEIKNVSEKGFLEIRPQNEFQIDKAKSYWQNECTFTKGYELEKDGFKFKTDRLGRTVSAEGEIKITENKEKRDMPPMEDVGKGYQREDDDRGHLIAHMFGGPDTLENLVPQNSHLNRSDYNLYENKLKKAVESGSQVYLKVEPRYERESMRPTELRMISTIDGEKTVTTFRNEERQKRTC